MMFTPSEIARLVLGYLRDVSCHNSANLFLQECPHLNEYREGWVNGFSYPTNYAGKNLKMVLNEYYAFKLTGDLPITTPTREQNVLSAANTPSTIEMPRSSSPESLLTRSDRILITETERNKDHESPRRKIVTPRRKANSASTSKQSVDNRSEDVDSHAEDGIDFSALLDQVMKNPELPEKLAENINKAISNTTVQPSPGSKENTSTMGTEKINEVVNLTECEPLIEDVLTEFFDNIYKANSSLDETQNQMAEEQVTSPARNSEKAASPENAVNNSAPPSDEIPIASSVVEVTSSEVEDSQPPKESTKTKNNTNEPITNPIPIVEEVTTSSNDFQPNKCSTPAYILPSSSNHLILKTPFKSPQCLQLITFSPGQFDLNNLNFVLSSPYNDLLKEVENGNPEPNKNPLVINTEPQVVINETQGTVQDVSNFKSRVDRQVIRNLNFFSDTPETAQTKATSPALNTLVNSAKQIVQTDNHEKASHVRNLKFKTPAKSKNSRKTPIRIPEKEVANTLVSLSNSITQPNPPNPLPKRPNTQRKRRQVITTSSQAKRSKNMTGLAHMNVEQFLENLHYVN